MKFLPLMFFIASAFLAPAFSNAQIRSSKGTTTAKSISKEVDTYRTALSQAGLGANVEGLKALSEARPEINRILDSVSKELVKEKAQKNIRANKEQFDTLTEKINAAAAQAAEARASRQSYSGSAGKLLEATESLPGILVEVALAGPKADLQKAIDVARILSDVTLRDLSNEADASTKVRQLEERLGKDKDGNTITIEELIKRCLGGR